MDGLSRSQGLDNFIKEILHRVLPTEQLVLSDKRVRNMYLYLVCKNGTVQSFYSTPHYNIGLHITCSCWGSQLFFAWNFTKELQENDQRIIGK